MKRILLVLLGGLVFCTLAVAQTSDFFENGRVSLSSRGDELTIAHSSLPIGSRVRLTNARNGRTIEVTVTDRLSESDGRIADLSPTAWLALDLNADNEIIISPIPQPYYAETGTGESGAMTGEYQSDTQDSPINITIYNYVVRSKTDNLPVPGDETSHEEFNAELQNMMFDAQNANTRPVAGLPQGRGRYNIQVGAFSTSEAAGRTASYVRNAGFNVVQERSGLYYRVIVPDVPAAMVTSTVERLGAIGIQDVWVRE